MRERLSTGLKALLAAALYLGLAGALAAVMLAFPASAAETDLSGVKVSPWAAAEVAKALDLGLTDEYLAGDVKDFTVSITRDKFCELALNYLARLNDNLYFRSLVDEYKVAKRPDGQADNPFTDRNTEYTEYGAQDVTICYYLGIAKGYDDGSFGYGKTISRQEVAALLLRTYEVCGGALPEEGAEITFTDGDDIPDWARENASALSVWGVMKGDENGNFNPKGLCTYEQAVLMFLRLYENAPVSRANGNVKQMFTYEQCMEFLKSLSGVYGITDMAEGPGVTYVRLDQGIMSKASSILLVCQDGRICQVQTGIQVGGLTTTLPSGAIIENIQFSQDGKTFSCTITLWTGYKDDGTPIVGVYQLTVDVDTMECETVQVSLTQ